MSNRSVLREQNLKLKSEVHILQQALMNLSLNDINIQSPQQQQQQQKPQIQTALNEMNENNFGNVQLQQTQDSCSNNQLSNSFLNQQIPDHSSQQNCGYFNMQQQPQPNEQKYHQQLYQQLVSQAQLKTMNINTLQPVALNQQQLNTKDYSTCQQQQTQQVIKPFESDSFVLNNSINSLNINSNSYQTPTSNKHYKQQQQNDSGTKYQSLQNREYIKQRVSSIIKDATKGVSNQYQSTVSKENQLLIPVHQPVGPLNDMHLKVSGSKIQQTPSQSTNHNNNLRQISQNSSTSQKQAQGFEITTNSSLHNSATVTPQPIIHQIEENSNIKYQQEIENLKNILFEIGQKENEMISKLNEHEKQIQTQPLLIQEREDYFLKEIEVRDQQLIEAQQHIAVQDQEIEQLQLTNKEMQMRLNTLQLEVQTKSSLIENQQIKYHLIENELQLLRQENQRLRQKPQQLTIMTQTQQEQKIDAEVNTDNFIETYTLQNNIMEMTAERQLDFTLNQNHVLGTEEKNFANSTIASPKNQSSYMQTPTRSALQQFIYNSSAKKNDEFYRSHIFNRSSVIKESINNHSIQKNNQTRNQPQLQSIQSDFKIQELGSTKSNSQQQNGIPPLSQVNVKCNVQNKLGTNTSLSSFITKQPSQQINTVIEEQTKLTQKSVQMSNEKSKQDKKLILMSPSSNNSRIKQSDISLRCPAGQRDASLESCNNKSSFQGQRTPQNSKKTSCLNYQKASSILRSRYQTSSTLQQNLTPVRQQKSMNPYQPNSNLSSHREVTPQTPIIHSITLNENSSKKSLGLSQYTTKTNQLSINSQNNTKQVISQTSTTRNNIHKSDVDQNFSKSSQNLRNIKQNYQSYQNISIKQMPETTTNKNFVSVNQKIQQTIITNNKTSQQSLNTNILSPSQSDNSIVLTQQNLVQNTQSFMINHAVNNLQHQQPIFKNDSNNKSFNDQYFQQNNFDNQQQNQALLRKQFIEEERKRELMTKIQAKEVKIHNILEQKKQEKEFREQTYEDRREKFKNEVKERRENLSKTPVKGRNTSANSRQMQSIHKKCVQSPAIINHQVSFQNFNHNQSNHDSSLMQNDILTQNCFTQNSLSHNRSRDYQHDKSMNRSLSEGRISRKIIVNQEEEDETPMPLDVKISPIKNKEQFQYDL